MRRTTPERGNDKKVPNSQCERYMSYVIKRLAQEGWINVGGKGDHIKFKHPDKQGHVVVPHPRKDVVLGTLRNIYRQAGWEWE